MSTSFVKYCTSQKRTAVESPTSLRFSRWYQQWKVFHILFLCFGSSYSLKQKEHSGGGFLSVCWKRFYSHQVFFFLSHHFLERQNCVFCWASWFWNHQKKLEFVVFVLVYSDLCLDSCPFYSASSKKGMTCLLLSRVLFACCVVQAHAIVEKAVWSVAWGAWSCVCAPKKACNQQSEILFN